MSVNAYKEHVANLISIVLIITIIWIGMLGLKFLHDRKYNVNSPNIITCSDLTDEGKAAILKDINKCEGK